VSETSVPVIRPATRRRWRPAIYEPMYEVAVAGDMAVVPPDGGPSPVHENQRRHLPSELAHDAVVVGPEAELLQAIRQV